MTSDETKERWREYGRRYRAKSKAQTQPAPSVMSQPKRAPHHRKQEGDLYSPDVCPPGCCVVGEPICDLCKQGACILCGTHTHRPAPAYCSAECAASDPVNEPKYIWIRKEEA